jgi:hypothetical protein
MPVPPSNTEDTQAIIGILIAIAAYLLVTHWRTTLRVILVVAIALAMYGAVVGIDGATSLMTPHHQ